MFSQKSDAVYTDGATHNESTRKKTAANGREGHKNAVSVITRVGIKSLVSSGAAGIETSCPHKVYYSI